MTEPEKAAAGPDAIRAAAENAERRAEYLARRLAEAEAARDRLRRMYEAARDRVAGRAGRKGGGA